MLLVIYTQREQRRVHPDWKPAHEAGKVVIAVAAETPTRHRRHLRVVLPGWLFVRGCALVAAAVAVVGQQVA